MLSGEMVAELSRREARQAWVGTGKWAAVYLELAVGVPIQAPPAG